MNLGRVCVLSASLAGVFSLGTTASPVRAIDSVQIAAGLDLPVWAVSPPGDYERLFIVLQRGVVRIFNLLTGELNPVPFLDIEASVHFEVEHGLHALAFHPDYGVNGHFFVKYSNLAGDTVIARFVVDDTNPDLADPTSEEIVLEVAQSGTVYHKGGNLAFSPQDGFLYIPLGDGMVSERAQDPQELLGKILRIDVNELPYSIPPDNPFAGANDPLDETRDEIWGIGFRNPFRIAFDALSGDLYIGDVGADSREEIDFQAGASPGGENYGWRCMEGNECTGLSGCPCGGAELTYPIYSYSHALTGNVACVIGGCIYRGDAIPELTGEYFYANFTSATIFSFSYDGNPITQLNNRTGELEPAGSPSIGRPVAFCTDAYGEVYIVDRGTSTSGEIYKIVPDDIQDRDCNGNLIVDSAEITVGVTLDGNGNNVPDECETPPTILTQPASEERCLGAIVTFAVTVSGTRPISYQWRKDGRILSGATSQNHAISPVTVSDFGSYDVVVSDRYGTVTSDPAELTPSPPEVCSLPFIRGDADGNGTLDALLDILYLLGYGFLGMPPPPCLEAAEVDGDGELNPLMDSLYLLAHAFSGAAPPSAPYPNCGIDPTPQVSLSCSASGCP